MSSNVFVRPEHQTSLPQTDPRVPLLQAQCLALLMLWHHTNFNVRPRRLVRLAIPQNNAKCFSVRVSNLIQYFDFVHAAGQHCFGFEPCVGNGLLNMLVRVTVTFMEIDERAVEVDSVTIGHGKMGVLV